VNADPVSCCKQLVLSEFGFHLLKGTPVKFCSKKIRCERALSLGMVALALTLAFGFAAHVEAAVIPLFTTGVDGSGNALAAGAVDPHSSLVASDDANFPIPNAHVVGNPPASWVKNTTFSQWIAPNPLQGGDSPPTGDSAGTYIYEIKFDLGLAPSQESIVGDWAVNTIGLILLNGQYVGGTTNLSGPGSLTSFSIPSSANFVAGVNTLDFVVVNANQGATGLYVGDIRGSFTPGIPEPSSFVLAGLGVCGLLVHRLRRSRSK
jgi:hypothetical protein